MKKIEWWTPQVGEEEKVLISQILEKSFPNEGEYTSLLENKVATLLGSRHAVAVTSGTAALFLSLKAIGVGQGDEVIVPDLTFIATANAVQLCGATPVLVDVDPRRLTIDPAGVEQAITPKTKAVVPVHVSGRAADMDSLGDIASAHGIYVVEDAAEGFFSKHNGRCLGTIGSAGCFSFSAAKIITTGQGGMIVTNDDVLYGQLRELKDQGRPTRGTGGDDIHYSIGYNFKFTDLQAALGLGQMTHLYERMERMRLIYETYDRELRGVDGITLFSFDIDRGEAPQWTDAKVERRDGLDAYLRSRDIDCRRYWLPLHRQRPYLRGDDDFPVSTSLSPKALWLPSSFTLDESDVRGVCDHIKAFMKGSKA
ncbi:MAG: DegT/DnrJ/EryC1/StrS family aminotransferase [Syntrophorhabdales bacterium]|jgi:perosamine synthetase